MPFRYCGLKCSVCCAVFSAWGFIMLGLMGVFYTIEASAFIDDIPIDLDVWAKQNYTWQYITDIYHDCALTCFFAMGCYVVTFVLSIAMFAVNKYVLK